MAGFNNEVMYAKNVDFSGSTSVQGRVTANGQLLIGSAVAPNIRVNTLTAGSGITITNSPGQITISSKIMSVSGYLTSQQIKSLNSNPVEVIPASGDGTVICPINITRSFVYGGNNVFIADLGQTIDVYYSTVRILSGLCDNSALTDVINSYRCFASPSVADNTSLFNNLPLYLYNQNPIEISGNDANDNYIYYEILYIIVNL